MLKTIIKIALRNLFSRRISSFTNLFGLTTGFTISILILLYIVNELSYDSYHRDAEQIFRIAFLGQISNQQFETVATPAPLAFTMVQDLPEVIDACRVFSSTRSSFFSSGEEKFYEKHILYVDSSFLNMFSINLIHGDKTACLTAPYSVLLEEETARRYFGDNDPVGESIKMNNDKDYTVTGVFERIPANSHFAADFLISFTTVANRFSKDPDNDWGSFFALTYILTDPLSDIDELSSKLPAFVKTHMLEDIPTGNYSLETRLQPLTSIHLHSNLMGEIQPTGNMANIYILSAIAVFIIIIACINFMNLSTARAADRAKEIAIKKVIGSGRRNLIAQFMVEAILLCIIAFIISITLIDLGFPFFNLLTDKQQEFHVFQDWKLIIGFIGLALLTGILSGSYPSFVLSGFCPAAILKGKLATGSRNALFRNILIGFQFALTAFLIVSSTIIHNQYRYINKKDLGMDTHDIMIIPFKNNEIIDNSKLLKENLLEIPEVTGVSLATNFPGGGMDGRTYFPDEMNKEDPWMIFRFFSDPDYINKILNLKILEGRNFSSDMSTDSSAIIINETLKKKLGWENPVGESIFNDSEPAKEYRIIGVVKDFHIQSLHEKIKPTLIHYLDRPARLALVRISPDNLQPTLNLIEDKWNELYPEVPCDYTFLDQEIGRFYREEIQFSKIASGFTIFSIIVALIGLFGLTSYITENRNKEIAIRKIMGSTVQQLSIHFSKGFLKLILYANIFAWPPAYIIISRWLRDFEYQTRIQIWVFVFAGCLTMVTGFITMNILIIKNARANPVRALRYE